MRDPAATKGAVMGSATVQAAFAAMRDVPVFMCLCRDNNVVAVNRFAAGVLGLEAEEEEGVRGSLEDFLSPAYRGMGPAFLDMIAGEPDGARLKWIGRQGNVTDLEVFSVKPDDAAETDHFLVGIDVTAMKRSVELLQAREARYRSIVENASSMICETVDGRITCINAAGLHLLGTTDRNTVEGHHLSSIFHDDYRILLEDQLGILIDEARPFPLPLIRRDGETRDVEINLTPLDGNIREHLLVEIRDITRQNRALQALHDLNRNLEGKVSERTEALRQAQDRLARTSRLEAVGTFAGGIAHEINTPIQFIADNLRFLEETFGEIEEMLKMQETVANASDVDYVLAEAPSAINQSISGVTHIAKVVQAMRDFADTKPVTLEVVDLRSLLEGAHEALQRDFDCRIELSCLPASENMTFWGEAAEMRQALAHVVSNSVWALKDREPSDRLISVGAYLVGEHVRIDIADNGVGMCPDVAKRAFDPFYTTREVGDGIGQGLAICHHIVCDIHNGDVWISSAEGEGTTVHISIPVTLEEDFCESFEGRPALSPTMPA